VEWLVVSFMDGADAASNIRNWVEPIISLSGFPILEMQVACDPPPELMNWWYEGRDADLAARLGVDEAHRYQGVAKLAGATAVRLARLYIVIARRGTVAWMFALSFETASLPGMPVDLIDSNDQVRAGATFGNLRLL
jgi:hypothetical protein